MQAPHLDSAHSTYVHTYTPRPKAAVWGLFPCLESCIIPENWAGGEAGTARQYTNTDPVWLHVTRLLLSPSQNTFLQPHVKSVGRIRPILMRVRLPVPERVRICKV